MALDDDSPLEGFLGSDETREREREREEKEIARMQLVCRNDQTHISQKKTMPDWDEVGARGIGIGSRT